MGRADASSNAPERLAYVGARPRNSTLAIAEMNWRLCHSFMLVELDSTPGQLLCPISIAYLAASVIRFRPKCP
jgi:hypothetical protein